MMACKNVKEIDLSELQLREENISQQVIIPKIELSEYKKQCQKALDYIKNGDIYQVNYSFPCSVEITTPAFNLFKQLESDHPVPYACYFDTGKWQIISQSPELFLAKNGRRLSSKPMKGTSHRGLTFDQDKQAKHPT